MVSITIVTNSKAIPMLGTDFLSAWLQKTCNNKSEILGDHARPYTPCHTYPACQLYSCTSPQQAVSLCGSLSGSCSHAGSHRKREIATTFKNCQNPTLTLLNSTQNNSMQLGLRLDIVVPWNAYKPWNLRYKPWNLHHTLFTNS